MHAPVSGFVLACCLSLAAHAQAVKDGAPIVTNHQIQIGGKTVKYTAEVGRVPIRDVETGEPHGYMFYTAYRIPSTTQPRPVTFVWNGGPGADSSLLHFSVVGPKLAQDGHLTDNADTWLTASDLVLVDPIGTGFSRPAKAEYAQEFYGTVGDVASVTEFVRAWRLLHRAERAPVFLVGESWGAGRAASVGYALEDRGITVNGLVLISGGWGLTQQYGSATLRSALNVVDMAATALYYGKTAPELGKDVATVRRAAEKWVRETYAPALTKIDSLSQAQRDDLIRDLTRFTGLEAAQIDPKTLVITQRQFRTSLLKKALYIFDMRKSSGPAHEDAPTILSYLRDDLGYRADLPHIGLEDAKQGFAPTGKYPESVNERWNYATAQVTPEELEKAMAAAASRGDGPPKLGPPLPGTAEALKLNPRMKVLVAAGLYDSFLPCATGEEIASELPNELRTSITFKCYTGGHAMYLDAPTRAELSRDVKSLIASSH
jgi:carboxypeptidase C (cathepsin A)